MDYREIPAEFEKAFDAFISVEMLEASLILNDHFGYKPISKLACRSEVLRFIF